MLEFDKLSPAQERWVVLLEHFFPEVYKTGEVSHKQLVAADNKFREMRATDKKYKVSWPIWLISNNATTRGKYHIPKKQTEEHDASIETHPFYAEYVAELKEFGIE